MKWITENWSVIVAVVCAVSMIVDCVIKFYLEPKSTKIANVREWLLYAVTEAEKQFGGGTGTLKLHYVYNLAVEKFPWLASVITFDTFSAWVDDALIWMRTQLESNKNVKDYVEGEENGVQ